MRRLLWVLLLAGCGRIGFDAPADGADVDTPVIDGPVNVRYPSTVLADAPVAYYRLAETSLGAIADATGHGHEASHRLFGGTVTFGSPGALAGDSDLGVTLMGDGNAGPNVGAGVWFADLDVWGGDFTIEGWLRPEQPPVGWDNAFFLWEDYQVSGFRTGWLADFSPELWTTEAGASSVITSPTPLVQGAWNYLVFTKAGPTVTIYLAGQPVASGTITYNVPPVSADNCLGACHGMPTEAVFDELAIYDRALTPAEIAAHYDAGITP